MDPDSSLQSSGRGDGAGTRRVLRPTRLPALRGGRRWRRVLGAPDGSAAGLTRGLGRCCPCGSPAGAQSGRAKPCARGRPPPMQPQPLPLEEARGDGAQNTQWSRWGQGVGWGAWGERGGLGRGRGHHSKP